MCKLSEVYANSGSSGKDILIRNLFDTVENQQKRIDKLEGSIAHMMAERQPLNHLANGTKSWLPRFNGNDAG